MIQVVRLVYLLTLRRLCIISKLRNPIILLHQTPEAFVVLFLRVTDRTLADHFSALVCSHHVPQIWLSRVHLPNSVTLAALATLTTPVWETLPTSEMTHLENEPAYRIGRILILIPPCLHYSHRIRKTTPMSSS